VTAPAWREGIVARYLTVVGSTVDPTATVDVEIEDADPTQRLYVPRCHGCNATSAVDFPDQVDAEKWAQDHAATCRAMPRPEPVR
jgi:hypothetical protein